MSYNPYLHGTQDPMKMGLGGTNLMQGPTRQNAAIRNASNTALNIMANTGQMPGPTNQAAALIPQIAANTNPIATTPKAQSGSLSSLFDDSENLSSKDKYLALMMAGFGMAEAGGTPGATFLGSLGSGGKTFGSVLSQLEQSNEAKKAQERDRRIQERKLGIQEATSMLPNDKLSKLIRARDLLPENDPNRKFYEDAIVKETTRSNTNALGKLIDARDALPLDDPNRALYDAAIKKKTESEGLTVQTNPDGSTTVRMGVIGQGDELGSGMTKDLQTQINEASGYLDTVRQMEMMYDPKMMQIPQRAWLKSRELGEKFNLSDLTQEERFELERFNSMKSDSQSLLSAVIKSLAGAAVSVQEQARIEGFLPTFGIGVFDGDSPSAFQDKMKKFMSSTESAIMRSKMMLKGKPITGPQSYTFPLQIANPETKRMMWFSDFANQMRSINEAKGIGTPSDEDISNEWKNTVKTLRKKR